MSGEREPGPNADNSVGLVLQIFSAGFVVFSLLAARFAASSAVNNPLNLGGAAGAASDVQFVMVLLMAALIFFGGVEVRSSGKTGFMVLLLTGGLLCLMGVDHSVFGALLIVYSFLRLNGRFGPAPL